MKSSFSTRHEILTAHTLYRHTYRNPFEIQRNTTQNPKPPKAETQPKERGRRDRPGLSAPRHGAPSRGQTVSGTGIAYMYVYIYMVCNVCVCVCVCACMHAHIYIYICTRMRVYVDSHRNKHMMCYACNIQLCIIPVNMCFF